MSTIVGGVLSGIHEDVKINLSKVINDIVVDISDTNSQEYTDPKQQYVRLATLTDRLLDLYELYGNKIGQDQVKLMKQLMKEPGVKRYLRYRGD